MYNLYFDYCELESFLSFLALCIWCMLLAPRKGLFLKIREDWRIFLWFRWKYFLCFWLELLLLYPLLMCFIYSVVLDFLGFFFFFEDLTSLVGNIFLLPYLWDLIVFPVLDAICWWGWVFCLTFWVQVLFQFGFTSEILSFVKLFLSLIIFIIQIFVLCSLHLGICSYPFWVL